MYSTGRFYYVFLGFFLTVSAMLQAVVDNRYLPQFNASFIRRLEPTAAFDVAFFGMTGDSARSDTESVVNLPEIFGKYDLARVAKGLELATGVNYLKPEWQAVTDIVWEMAGELHAQGARWTGERQIGSHLAVGCQLDLMHLSSNIEFKLTTNIRTNLKIDANSGSELEIRRNLRDTNRALGLDADQWNKTDISDIDLYLRLMLIRDYMFKARRIDFGLRLGTYLPSGPERDISNPASIPFGGNGHTGFYLGLDLNFELKEDCFFNLSVQLVNRLSAIKTIRMPVAGPTNTELFLFGGVAGRADVDPGITFTIAPELILRDFFAGAGLRVAYRYTHHEEDFWADLRPNPSPQTYLSAALKKTGWDGEYLTLGLTYNWGKTDDEAVQEPPLFYLSWDQPVNLFGTEAFAKTHRAILGISYSF